MLAPWRLTLNAVAFFFLLSFVTDYRDTRWMASLKVPVVLATASSSTMSSWRWPSARPRAGPRREHQGTLACAQGACFGSSDSACSQAARGQVDWGPCGQPRGAAPAAQARNPTGDTS
jgi:hypothetical protein